MFDFKRALATGLILVQQMVLASPLIPSEDTDTIYAIGLEMGTQVIPSSVYNPATFSFESRPGYSPPPLDADARIGMEAYPKLDARRIGSIGVNQANLVPEGIDLELFPVFPLSEELSLKPSLSYSPDSTFTRRGLMNYAPPKQWRTHYGELVRMIPSQRKQHESALGPLKNSGAGQESDRHGIAVEVQTYFINATGQEVNFYPDPASPVQPDRWFSDSGNYRLRKTGTTSYQIDTPTGLVFYFQTYKHYLNSTLEILSLHFRVEKMVDRHGNEIRLQYGDVSGQLKRNQPVSAQSFKAGSATPFQEVRYTYDSDHRLTRLEVPKPLVGNPEVVQTNPNGQMLEYLFHYPDEPGFFESGQAGSAQAVPGDNTKLQLQPLNPQGGIQGYAVLLPTNGTADLFLDLSLWPGGNLSPVDDYSGIDDPELTHLGIGSYFFKLGNGSDFFALDYGKRRFRNQLELPGPVRYRYSLDDAPGYGHYPASLLDPNSGVLNLADTPDRLHLRKTESSLSIGEYDAQEIAIFPALKKGDLFIDGNNPNLRYILTEADLDPVTGITNPEAIATNVNWGSSTDIRHIRADNRYRIAAIDFPASAASGTFTQRRMRLTYDDGTLNHQEIKTVGIYYLENGSNEHLLQETEYRYEVVRSLGTHEEAMARHMAGSGDPNAHVVCGEELNFQRGNSPDRIRIGINLGAREQEVCLLKEKTVRFAKNPGGAMGTPLTTRFGGRFHLTLAGVRKEVAPSGGPLFGPNHECNQVQWAIDGKMFDVTWKINPDGSGEIYDLNPDGLVADPYDPFPGNPDRILDDYLTYNARRSQISKTYLFDTVFGTALAAAHPHLPFFQHMPGYPDNPGVTVGQVEENFGAYYAHAAQIGATAQPTVDQLFNLGAACHQVSLTGYEPVAAYPYGLEDHVIQREHLRALHGAVRGMAHFRSSGIRRMGEISGLSDTQVAQFLDGELSHVMNGSLNGHSFSETVVWDQGGQANLGNGLQAFSDQVQMAQWQPSFNLSLSNYGGFTWNDGIQIFQDPLAVQRVIKAGTQINVERYSNGGLLGTHPMGMETAAMGAASLPANLIGLGLKPGDMMVHDKLFYKILSVDGSGISFTPSLRTTIPQNRVLYFYRTQNTLEDVPPYNDPSAKTYVGYDEFGNQALSVTYTGTQYLHWGDAAHARGDFIPDFDQSTPAALNWNNSTNPALTQNDWANWRYFGLVTRSFSSHILPFFNYSAADEAADPIAAAPATATGGLNLGIATAIQMDALFPWKPLQTTQFYRPLHISGWPLQGSGPLWAQLKTQVDNFVTTGANEHAEDLITQMAYEPSQAPNQGKLIGQKSWKRTNNTNFTQSYWEYDGYGRMSAEVTASFKNDTALYGAKTTPLREGNTGLPVIEKIYVGPVTRDGWELSVPNTALQNQVHFDYDLLSRVTQTYARPGGNAILGSKTVTQYLSPFETITHQFKHDDSTQLAKTTSYADGLGRSILSINQLGSTGPLFATGTLYDDVGRQWVQFSEAATPSFPQWTPSTTIEQIMGNAGTVQTLYNLRSEAVASVTSATGNGPGTTNWQWPSRTAGQGNAVTIGFFAETGTEAGEAQFRINFKQQLWDEFGQLQEVRDFAHLPATEPSLTTPAEVETFLNPLLAADGTLPWQDPVTRAVYNHDRFGNIVTANVGISNQQERNFRFDSRGRLRYEDHPEMGEPLAYADFDLFEQARNMQVGDGSFRREERQYDATGKLTRATYFGAGETFQDDWTYTVPPHPHPGLPETVLAQELIGNDAQGIGYRFTYRQQDGALLTKALLHNMHNTIPVAYVNVPDLAQVTGQWDSAPTLSITYDDVALGQNLGWPVRLAYPLGTNDQRPGEQVEWVYRYEELYGSLPIAIDDNQLGTPVVHGIQYHLNKLVEQFQYGLGEGTYSNRTDFDALNRTAKQTFYLNGPEYQRTYGYDHGQRIRHIQRNGNPYFEYRYDTLGQIAKADLLGHDGLIHKFTYTYDSIGLGNLTHRQEDFGGQSKQTATPVSLTKNQLSGFNYEAATGELLTAPRADGETLDLAYSPKGRLNRVIANQDENATFVYDPFGMRVLTSHEKGNQTLHRLYFYDQNQQVTSEWVIDPETGEHRWDRHYLYLEGRSVATYEWDPGAESEAESGGTGSSENRVYGNGPPPPALLVKPVAKNALITWGSSKNENRYDLQAAVVQDGVYQVVHAITAITGNSYHLPLPLGDYALRVAVHGSFYSPWQSFTLEEDNLKGLYHFDGNFEDASQFGNHGSGSQTQILATGVVNQAVRFLDLDQSYVQVAVPSALPLGTESRTYLGWVRTTAATPLGMPPRVILDHGPLGGPSGSRVRLQLNGDQLQIDLNGSTVTPDNKDGVLSPATWHHVAVTYDGTDWRIYLDGSLVKVQTGLTFSTQAGPLTFGNAEMGTGAALPLDGDLDEWGIHNRAWTAAEILQAASQ